MRNKIAVVAALTTLLGVATVHAQAPKPAPENDIVKKATGTWTCEGTAKGPDGQEMKYKSTWTIKSTLGGHWYAIVYKRAKMGTMPPFEGNAMVGYKVAEKKYVFVGFDNAGSWVDLSSSDVTVRPPASFGGRAGDAISRG